MSTEQTESFQEQLSRVEQMAEGDSATWDLSDNDVAALQAVIADRQRIAKKLNDLQASSSSEGASLAALQQKLAQREHEITEGGEMRDSLRDEIAVLEQRLAEVTRHLTEAQGQCRCFREAYDRESQWRATAEQRAEAAEATIEGMLTVGANFARRQLDTTPTAPAAPAAGTLEHRCGVRGFADSGDECPACADAARRRAGTPAKEDA